jgi:hypothetical protein
MAYQFNVTARELKNYAVDVLGYSWDEVKDMSFDEVAEWVEYDSDNTDEKLAGWLQKA